MCSSHGVCNADTNICHCDVGYYLSDCSANETQYD